MVITRPHIFCFVVIISALFYFLVPNNALASITIPTGSISVNTTWDKDSGPYIITGQVTIVPGVTLTIQPGTIIKFDDSANLDVGGNIIAEGTAALPIYFTSLKDDSVGGDSNSDGDATTPTWNDYWWINFASSGSSFKRVHVSYSSGGLSLKNASGNIFQDMNMTTDFNAFSVIGGEFFGKNIAMENIWAGVSANGGALVTIDQSTLQGTARAGQGIRINNSSLNLSHTDIQAFDKGVYILGASHATGTMNVLHDNTKGVLIESGVHQVVVPYILKLAAKVLQNIIPLPLRAEAATVLQSSVSFSNNSIKGNTSFGVVNSATNQVDFTNNWWGDAAGPGGAVSGNVTFSPWLTHEPTETPVCCSSVLFLPGIEASRLYKQGSVFENQLWEPNRNKDVQTLYLSSNGSSTESGIYTRDIIDEGNIVIPSVNVYKTFISSMDKLVSDNTISAWKPMPYDWRFSATDIAGNGGIIGSGGIFQNQTYEVRRMTDELKKLAASSKTGKITLVAHSYGGIVAKALVRELEKTNDAELVDKIIFVAVPELGTPQAVASLLHGYETELLGGFVLDRETGRTLAENMPSAYNLLPSSNYFSGVTEPVITFDSSVSKVGNLLKNGSQIASLESLNNFLLGINDKRTKPAPSDIDSPNVLNSSLLGKVEAEQAALSSYSFPSNIQLFQIAGWGVDTLKGIRYFAKTETKPENSATNYSLDYEPLLTSDGDRTVVSPSASAIATSTYYLDIAAYNNTAFVNRSHASILEIQSAREMINNILQNHADVLPNFITRTKPVVLNKAKELRIGVHSPVSLDAYDDRGNHTGIIPAASSSDFDVLEEQIPNSYYMNFGDAKYIGMEDYGVTSTFKLLGTGIGTFTLTIDTISNGAVASTTSFADIPVLPSTSANLTITSTSTVPRLNVDLDGDGQNDFSLKVGEDIDPVSYLLVMRSVILSLNLAQNIEKQTLKKIDDVVKLLSNDKTKRAKIKVKNYIKTIKRKAKHSKKIDPADADTILEMLKQLLAAIN